MANTVGNLNALFKEIYADKMQNMIPTGVGLMRMLLRDSWTVEDWMKVTASEHELGHFPNAVAAKKIMDSKLYKVMK